MPNYKEMYFQLVAKVANAVDFLVEAHQQGEYDYSKEESPVILLEERYNTLKNLLLKKKNIILQGAPGVGKTYAAERLAYSIMGEK